MTLYRIYAKMIASRRYQVTGSFKSYWWCGRKRTSYSMSTSPLPATLALLSPRPYPKGCIINPTTVIRELIAARREE